MVLCLTVFFHLLLNFFQWEIAWGLAWEYSDGGTTLRELVEFMRILALEQFLSKLEFTESGDYIVQSAVEAMELQSICSLYTTEAMDFLVMFLSERTFQLATIYVLVLHSSGRHTSLSPAIFLDAPKHFPWIVALFTCAFYPCSSMLDAQETSDHGQKNSCSWWWSDHERFPCPIVKVDHTTRWCSVELKSWSSGLMLKIASFLLKEPYYLCPGDNMLEGHIISARITSALFAVKEFHGDEYFWFLGFSCSGLILLDLGHFDWQIA